MTNLYRINFKKAEFKTVEKSVSNFFLYIFFMDNNSDFWIPSDFRNK